jgi:ATP-binding cassette subfamily F protein uup
MNLLTVDQIEKSFGERVLFSDLSFGINKDQRIALIAKNGTGKTSILRILAGRDVPDKGQVSYRKGLRLSLLEQEPDLDPNLTVEQTVNASNNPILKVITQYNTALQNPEDEAGYQKAYEAMERYNAWDFETQYKQILFRLKLEDLQAPVSTLSGGQKKRLALANALINKPDLLILDEPTNHLDLEMIEWLEAFFAREGLTLLMVTHDRYFLERVCTEILELDNHQLYTYKGNYSYYLEKKQGMQEQEAVTQHKAKLLYKQELEWMRRQPKARTSKSKARIDEFKSIRKEVQAVRREEELQLELNMERLGSKTVELHNVSKKFPGATILEGFDYVFKRGERVGIIGRNGSGKTTFLNLITGTEVPDKGKVVVGDTVSFGYYTQAGIPIKEGQKVVEVIREYGDYIPLKKGRQISAQQLLERFLFDRKKQYDYVEKLSGGERKRLYLCTVLIQNPNFLILDEPTNDLDVVTLNVLENFLIDFPGCLLVVSHDRYFMDKIVDHLFVFRGDGVVDDFPGGYSAFRTYDAETGSGENARDTNATKRQEKSGWRDTDTGRKLSYSEKQEYHKLEEEIAKLEKERENLHRLFADDTISGEEINAISIHLKEIIASLSAKTERWFELAERLEN